MDFNQALADAFSAEPADLLGQLFKLHSLIQKAEEDEVVAIWYTLESAEKMIATDNQAGRDQLAILQKAVKSRMLGIVPGVFSLQREPKIAYFSRIVGSLL